MQRSHSPAMPYSPPLPHFPSADDALVPDEIAFSVLIRGMGRSKPPRWDSIMALLDTMEGRWGLQPSAPVFNALLDICVRTEDDARADTLLDRMWTGGVAPDAVRGSVGGMGRRRGLGRC